MEIDLKTVEKALEGRDGQTTALIEVLQDVQRRLKWLPKEALDLVAQRLRVPRSKVFAVATFYSAFHLKPRGKRVVRLCKGTACHVRGAGNLQDRIAALTGLEPGQTAADLSWTFETVACLGACAMAPVVVVDSKYHGSVRLGDVPRVLGMKKDED